MEENKDDEISIDTRKSKISGMHGKIKDFSSTPEISKKFSSVPENSDEEFSLDFQVPKTRRNQRFLVSWKIKFFMI